MGINELIQGKREQILRIAGHHGVKTVQIFGSFARGDARPDSDLDLLIESGPERTPFFPGGFVADLEVLLERKIDVVTKQALNSHMKNTVLREAVPL